jgi:riboflavin kinase/FMN adenylyltransferase
VTAAAPSALMIGVFDGVHRGHQSLIGHGVQVARDTGLRSVAVTFDPNPLEVLRPHAAPTRLCPIGRRVELIRGLGVDDVAVIGFDPELAAMPAEGFADDIVRGRFNAEHVVIGKGFRFGNRAKGTAQTLRDAGAVVDEFGLVGGDEPVSSTRVRAAVAAGDVAQAARLLGRPHEVEGVVVRGANRGRGLGYPTANIDHHRLAAVPADGVYAGVVDVDGHTRPAAVSVGTNPTFGGPARTVEAYILDFEADLYGSTLRVCFLERLRAMVAFDGLGPLIAQMKQDVTRTRDVVRAAGVD